MCRIGPLASARKALACALVWTLAACTPVVPPGSGPVVTTAPPVAAVALPPVAPVTLVDPPVEPAAAVLVQRGAEPPPVVLHDQPARLSPPGAPVVLPPPIPPPGSRQETLVEAVPTTSLMGRSDRRRFVAFLKAAGRGRFDALHLELNGRNRGAVRALADAARRAGVDPLKIRITETGPANGRVEVIATRYVAVAPGCPSLAIVGPSVNDNDFDPTHGCSNRANLAAMVNDPADLVRNDAVVAADGAYAARGIERYRASYAPGQNRAEGGYGQAPVDNGFAYGPLGGAVLGSGGPVSR
ncbi:putative cross-wall-targeting lipoprotein signal [Methylorubrum populi]|uniref:Putative cross-wall-targeting lipoprotein signal n=1 Tax=Methylorubrum populi TaxID=223967 RepID=A0A169QTG7_9HYPH|nr:CpaD family pilus assembly lipoprotein [Methylorubrum populi]BAU89942.1 putative cross-wall-targeting lipoprotein signal [Methylorubrum populi]